MSKKVAILQSNYIPWKGYFDLINSVDEFIFYDQVQYTKNDWRNRNRIKTKQGSKWLTIPVSQTTLSQSITDTKISDRRWNKKHWQTLKQNYSKAPFFKDYIDLFEELYLTSTETYLCDINYKFIIKINDLLGIKTKIRWSSEFSLLDGKTEKLIGLCHDCGADEYLSGSAAQTYLDNSLFNNNNIKVKWMDYSSYNEYKQVTVPFEHSVSVLDLLFNTGKDAKLYMKSFNPSSYSQK